MHRYMAVCVVFYASCYIYKEMKKMISNEMAVMIEGSSAIRAMFEEGAKLAEKYGKENVYDFSLGNPNVPAPAMINDAIKEVLDEDDTLLVHGYMMNAGYEDVRKTIADHLNEVYGTDFAAENIIMTVGAAGGMNVIFKTIIDQGDEVIAFAPFFAEYNGYAANHGAKLAVVPPNTENFQPNLDEFKNMINKKTKAVIINTPNNPTGVIYSDDTLKNLASIMDMKQKEFGTDIYLISDEPYRELVYDGMEVPYVTKFYANTIVGYSYSKSLSIPGERIGYLVILSEASDAKDLIAGAGVATRVLGFVNAPSLIQRAVAKCQNVSADIEAYNKNREALYDGLKEIGFECIKPEGAFYMFVKSPIDDEKEFCSIAKKFNILLVPGSSFACPGYVRIAYCVAYDTIVNSMPRFRELMDEIRELQKV